jgi:hypothetical protein
MNVGTAFYAVFLISIFAMGSSVVMAQQEFKFIDRNQYNYTLVLDHLISPKEDRPGEASLAISECPQTKCFHISGPLKHSMNRPTSNGSIPVGDLAIPGLQCEIHIVEVPKKILVDSGDYRVSYVDGSRDGKGCASLPTELTGFYQQVIQSSHP